MIRKWILQPGETRIDLPSGTRVLHVDEQYGDVCVWTDDTRLDHAPRATYVFIVVPTGSRSPVASYVGTVKMSSHGGVILMWHVYKLIELPDGQPIVDAEIAADIFKFHADRALAEGHK